ncbi:YdcF family protein [Glaciecola sp. 1036]|uniref:YdcF family protein n=1 Tax=Alteromonadaceae TaxID=72275 RepID=UPI003CFF2732
MDPVNQVLLLLAAGLIIYLKNKLNKTPVGKKPIWLFTIAFVWLSLCSQTWFSHILMVPLQRYSENHQVTNNHNSKQEMIFVLGGYYANYPDYPQASNFSPNSLQRLVHAYSLFKAKGCSIVVTGGYFLGTTDKSYAYFAKQFLISLGVPKEKIISIDEGTNSLEEIVSLTTHIDSSIKLTVISNASHIKRLDYLLKHNTDYQYSFSSVGQTPLELGDQGWFLTAYYNLEKSAEALYEYAALLKMLMQHIFKQTD